MLAVTNVSNRRYNCVLMIAGANPALEEF